MLTVWVDAWQMQCCGEPFVVGSLVSWTLAPVDDDEFASFLTAGRAPSITHREDHHGTAGPDPENAPRTSGIVRSINVLRCAYATVDKPDGRTMYPVAGSAQLTPTSSATGWEEEPGANRFVAYLVRLDAD